MKLVFVKNVEKIVKMNEEKPIEQKESIKLSRGMTGKYGWEIKLLGDPRVNTEMIKVFEDLDKKLKEKFGND